MKQLQKETRKALAKVRREFPVLNEYRFSALGNEYGGLCIIVKRIPYQFFTSLPAFLPGYEEPHEVDLDYIRAGGLNEANDRNVYGMSVMWPPYTTMAFCFLIELRHILLQYSSDVTILVDEEIDKDKIKEFNNENIH